MTVTVERLELTVGELHAFSPFHGDTDPTLRILWCQPSDRAVALGSRQSLAVVDEQACHAADAAIVRRRSGGGAVMIEPDSVVWIDVVARHGVLPEDIRGSMVWVGERWCEAIAMVEPDLAPRLSVHHGGVVATPWSSLICFAGRGPGEVIIEGANSGKLVGLSQRRTRHGIRVQSMVYLNRPPVDLAGLFAVEVPDDPPPPLAVLSSLSSAAPDGRRLVTAFADAVDVQCGI